MNQYVGLLELVCASSPIPTAEVLQDVSVLYARLGEYIQKRRSIVSLRVSRPQARPICACRPVPPLFGTCCWLSSTFALCAVAFLSGSRLLASASVIAADAQNDTLFLSSAALKCKIQTSGEQQDNNPELKLDHSYCSTLKGECLMPRFFSFPVSFACCLAD